MDRIKVGIVGLGWVAQVVHLPILLKFPEAEVVAICDRDRARARLVAEKFGLRNVYTDIDQMLEKQEMQVVIVCTSTDAHKEITLASLKAGKDVLVEKPIARHYAEAAAMAEAAREQKRKLMVGMNHRFRPDTMILKSFIEGKELGKIFAAKAGWLRRRTNDSAWTLKKEKSGGGVCVDLGIVMLDLCLWMLGYPEVKRVSASNYYNKTKQVEDTSLVKLVLKNAAQIDIEVSWSMFLDDDVYYCNVYGSDGSASLNPLRINKELHGSLVNLAPSKIEPPQHLFKRSYENELRHFLGAVRDLHPVISTAEEAVQRMRIIEAIYKSGRLGKEVVLS
jgi:predicted dehydrogenase